MNLTSSIGNSGNIPIFEPADTKKIALKEGQTLNVEASAMLACKNVEVKTSLNGSISSVVKRYFLGGESLFQNSYSAKKGGGWVVLEEAVPGQINTYELEPGKSLIMGQGAYVASDKNVKISTEYAGISGWWKGIGFAKLKATISDENKGRVFFSSSEGIAKAITINESEGPVIVDNNNMIAYTDSLKVTARKMGNMKSFFFSGEGSVNEFSGNGTVFLGSGESAARGNMLEKTVKIIAQAILPDAVTLINRVALLSLAYMVCYSPHIEILINSMQNLTDSLAIERRQYLENAQAGPGCQCSTEISIIKLYAGGESYVEHA